MIELQKKQLENNIVSQIEEIKNSFVNEGFENKTDNIKSIVLGLVETIKKIKENQNSYYNYLSEKLPILKYFENEIKDLNKIKEYLSDVINSEESEQNRINFANLIKSSEIYYFINAANKTKVNKEDLIKSVELGSLKEYIEAVWPSAKQEELLSLLIYINSGKATKDYKDYLYKYKNEDIVETKEDYLYKKFKTSLVDLVVKERNGEINIFVEDKTSYRISSANKLDSGVIIDEENKQIYLGFATSEYETSSQGKQYFKKIKYLEQEIKKTDSEYFGYSLNPIYITNSFINEHELKNKDREHKKQFLNIFSSKITEKEKNKINGLSFFSLVGNLKITDNKDGLKIEDILKVNPYITGSDTYSIYKQLDNIKNIVDYGIRHKELRDYIVIEIAEVLNILNFKIKRNKSLKIDKNIAEIFINIEQTINSVMECFNEKNMYKEDLYNPKFILNIKNIANLYKKIHLECFNGSYPDNCAKFMGNDFYSRFEDEKQIIKFIEKKNNFLKETLEIEEKTKPSKTNLENIIKNILELYKTSKNINNFKITEGNEKELIKDIVEAINEYPSRKITTILKEYSDKTKNLMTAYAYWEKNISIGKNKNKVDFVNTMFRYIEKELSQKNKKQKINLI